MDLCVMIEGQEGVTWEQWRALAAGCEQHGIPALFRSDHYLPLMGQLDRGVLDAWATICALGATTSTLRLGTLVSPATFRHPSLLAKLAATADQISGGRVELGIGAGWSEVEHRAYGFPFADTATRMAVFAEQIEIVRGLHGDATFAFAGDHYRLDGVDARPKPVQRPMPVIVGGGAGRRSAAIAARHADEYNTPFATADEARSRRAVVADAWREAGRDDAALRFSVMTGCLVGRDEDELLARAGRVAERNATGRSARAELDAVPESWIAGTPPQAVERLRALADAGVDRVMLQLLLHDEVDQLELIGGELAPAVS